MSTTEDGAATHGPSAVHAGPAQAPAVVVLDPAGESGRGTLPDTWRSLADRLAVTWCRLPVARQHAGVDATAHRELPPHGEVHLVAGGAAAPLALALAMDCRATIRSVLLVDPPPIDEHDVRVISREFDDRNVPVMAMVSEESGSAGPPLPLGHPEVAETVLRTVAQAGARSAALGRSTEPPAQRSLLFDALDAVLRVTVGTLFGRGKAD
ncbi:MAG TPA: hypothetical protein VG756_17645 [Pseudonocardiaceae bacterium]|jgi:hypothetical protein|nr:hypothetical protein [Pseudonocardiaceae bacterium]